MTCVVPFFRTLVIACCLITFCHAEDQLLLTGLPSTVITGTTYTLIITATHAVAPSNKQVTNETYSAQVDIATSDPAATLRSNTLTLTKGTATFTVVFSREGTASVTVTDPKAGGAKAASETTEVSTASAAAIAACGSCYATFGAGVVLQATKFGDYTNSSNVLQSTHLGAGTPQFTVGVAYKLPIPTFPKLSKRLKCQKSDFFSPNEEATAAYCYPLKAFVSLKFSPDASQTFNGFTYGVSHAIHKRLDILLGISFSAHNEISPGFQQAAVSTVRTQQAALNKYYSQWNLEALQNNGSTAFDGFPTQLQNADGTVGPLIYGGTPLILHYHSGFFIGVALPVSFRSAASGGN